MKKERFVLKKEIKLDENLAWLVGFYLAEGSKTRDYIGVSNNELCLINKSLRLFKKVLGIDKTSWTIWIKTNKRRHKEDLDHGSVDNYAECSSYQSLPGLR